MVYLSLLGTFISYFAGNHDFFILHVRAKGISWPLARTVYIDFRNLHSVALIDLLKFPLLLSACWEPSFCNLDRLRHTVTQWATQLGTFIL